MAYNNYSNQYPQLQNKVILNVDDNEMNRLVLSKIMQNAGVKTIQAENGAEAVKKLHDGLKPHAILMDLEMPVMDGVQASEVIRKIMNTTIPIIINSGLVSPYQKLKLKCLGINDYLEKPYSIKDIFSKIVKASMLVNTI